MMASVSQESPTVPKKIFWRDPVWNNIKLLSASFHCVFVWARSRVQGLPRIISLHRPPPTAGAVVIIPIL